MEKAQQAAERLSLSETDTFLYLNYLIEHREKVTMIQALPDKFLELHITSTVAKERQRLNLGETDD
jgi:hypothetical protein